MLTIKVDSLAKNPGQVDKIIEILREGGVICIPTDTVYGLASHAENEEAVTRIYNLKKRSRQKPLIIFPENKKELTNLTCKISLSGIKLIGKFWPGPLTILFKTSLREPWWLTGEEGKIGVRIPAHTLLRTICERGKISLATTSANLSGEMSITSPERLSPEIKNGLDALIDAGETPLGKESTIVDVTTSSPQTVREGYITSSEINKALKEKLKVTFVCSGNTCRSVMAEALFKKMLPSKYQEKIEVNSAGIFASGFSPASTFTQRVLRKRGIDVSSHRSTLAESNLIEQSDLVLTMEKKHVQHLIKLSPGAAMKIWTLREFTRGKEEDILDPAGGDESSYEKTCQEIEAEIPKILERLIGN